MDLLPIVQEMAEHAKALVVWMILVAFVVQIITALLLIAISRESERGRLLTITSAVGVALGFFWFLLSDHQSW